MWHIYVDMLTLNLLSASKLWYPRLVSTTLVPPWDLKLWGRVHVYNVLSPKQKCALVGPNIQLYPKQKHYNDKKLIFPIALFHSFPTVALFWQRARGSQTLNLPDCSDLWRRVSNSINCISSALLAKSSSNTSGKSPHTSRRQLWGQVFKEGSVTAPSAVQAKSRKLKKVSGLNDGWWTQFDSQNSHVRLRRG